MPWTPDDAQNACGDLLQGLMNALPDVNIEWIRADADGDDGLIFFNNQAGVDVRVKVSREALEDWLDADDRTKSRKESQLAECIRAVNEYGVTDHLITSSNLAP